MEQVKLPVFLRYAFALVGLFLIALGISMTIHSCLGIAPLSCPAYVPAMVFPSISVGTFVAILNFSMIFIQLAVLRGKFKLKYLLEIPVAFVLGYMVDFWELFLGTLIPSDIWTSLGMIVIASAITAIGIQLELIMKSLMLPIDLTVFSFTVVMPKVKFSTIKIFMDCFFVAATAIACLCIWGHPLGNCKGLPIMDTLMAPTQGVAIGLGTLIMSFLPGIFMIFTEKLADKILR